MRAFYGMRKGRVVHTEAVATADHEDQKRLARSRLHEFDCVEIWDDTVLCIRLRRDIDSAKILSFNAAETPSQVENARNSVLTSAA